MRRLVVATLLVGLACLPSSSTATPLAEAARASWKGLGVPYVRVPDDPGRGFRWASVRFHDTVVPYSEFGNGISSIAASADSAVVAPVDSSSGEFEGPLLEIGADGTTGVVEKHALGIPIADPLGHHVFWTARRSEKARLTAYDTRTHSRIRGPVLRRGTRVYAVDGATAFVSTSISSDVLRAYRWTVGEPGLTEVPLPSTGDGALISDVAGDLVLSSDFERMMISDQTGNVLSVLPPRLFLGTFSPDARFIARGGFEVKTLVHDLATGADVPLRGLGRWRPSDFRWSPTGALVVSATRRGVSWDDANPVRRFVCRLPSGRCDNLPGRSAVFLEPLLPSSALGQFITVMPYSRIGASKALRAHLSQN